MVRKRGRRTAVSLPLYHSDSEFRFFKASLVLAHEQHNQLMTRTSAGCDTIPSLFIYQPIDSVILIYVPSLLVSVDEHRERAISLVTRRHDSIGFLRGSKGFETAYRLRTLLLHPRHGSMILYPASQRLPATQCVSLPL
jgi:hypothetical protein